MLNNDRLSNICKLIHETTNITKIDENKLFCIYLKCKEMAITNNDDLLQILLQSLASEEDRDEMKSDKTKQKINANIVKILK